MATQQYSAEKIVIEKKSHPNKGRKIIFQRH